MQDEADYCTPAIWKHLEREIKRWRVTIVFEGMGFTDTVSQSRVNQRQGLMSGNRALQCVSAQLAIHNIVS